VRARVQNREQAVAELVASNDPPLKSCGVMSSERLPSSLWEVELEPRLEDPDPLLRETARAAKLRREALAANS